MAIPKLNIPECNSSENDIKLYNIVCSLRSMLYDVDDARSAVFAIEHYNLNKSQFDYPYGSFDEFKKHTLSGEFDVDIDKYIITKQEQEELDKAVRDGKLWVIY